MRRALEYVKAFGGVVSQHAQDPDLAGPTSCCHEGELSGRLGLPGWPGVAEEVIVARDVMLARHTGSRVHVAHASTAGTVEVLRWAKAPGHRRHRRGHPAPPAAHHRPAGRLRPDLQGQPAAAPAGGRRGPARRARRRHHRRRRHRPRAARAPRQGARVRRRGVRHARARDRAAGRRPGHGRARPDDLGRRRPRHVDQPGPHRRPRRPRRAARRRRPATSPWSTRRPADGRPRPSASLSRNNPWHGRTLGASVHAPAARRPHRPRRKAHMTDPQTIVLTGATAGIGLESALQLGRRATTSCSSGATRPSSRPPPPASGRRREQGRHPGRRPRVARLDPGARRRAARDVRRHRRAGQQRRHVYDKRALTGRRLRDDLRGQPPLGLPAHRAGQGPRPQARSSSPPRPGHYGGTMDFDDLGFEQGYSVMKSYGRSKLANVIVRRAAWPPSSTARGVTVNALHPGAVATDIWMRRARGMPARPQVAKLFMVHPREGRRPPDLPDHRHRGRGPHRRVLRPEQAQGRRPTSPSTTRSRARLRRSASTSSGCPHDRPEPRDPRPRGRPHLPRRRLRRRPARRSARRSSTPA